MSDSAQTPSWPMFHRVWRRAELLERMIEALAIPPLAAVVPDAGEAYARARSQCLACTRAPDCRAALAEAHSLALPPAFCPNANYFARCRTAADLRRA